MSETEIEVVKRHMSNPPVDPERILRELDVRVSTADLPDEASGNIRRLADGRYAVNLNANESGQRRRFTAAHELAHFILHRDLIDEHGHLDRLYSERGNPSQPLTGEHEVQANKLAAQILMPATKVRQWYDMEPIEGLASKFGVSVAAMRIRLKTLGLPYK